MAKQEQNPLVNPQASLQNTVKSTTNLLISQKGKVYLKQRPISSVYPVIDTDLGRDNVENDLTAADLQDL
jgi:hypothetical protein